MFTLYGLGCGAALPMVPGGPGLAKPLGLVLGPLVAQQHEASSTPSGQDSNVAWFAKSRMQRWDLAVITQHGR